MAIRTYFPIYHINQSQYIEVFMPSKKQQRAMIRGQQQRAKTQMHALTEQDKKALLERFKNLKSPVRHFVSEIFDKAKEARGQLDDDVYGVLYATLEALTYTGGTPPPLVFGISHYQTGKVEQVRFVPQGVTQLPPHGKFLTNHPALNPAQVNSQGRLEK
ncbi:MAG: exonuclease VII large subunit [Candidatus Latescibacterota bacterium]|jgi:exonuclease VII large subunit